MFENPVSGTSLGISIDLEAEAGLRHVQVTVTGREDGVEEDPPLSVSIVLYLKSGLLKCNLHKIKFTL